VSIQVFKALLGDSDRMHGALPLTYQSCACFQAGIAATWLKIGVLLKFMVQLLKLFPGTDKLTIKIEIILR
jgi:hypothetical protein